jgi:hypothetical protein
LLPLTSTGFYPDGNSPGKSMENSGKQNPKMGFKSPTEERRKSSRRQETTPSIDLPIKRFSALAIGEPEGYVRLIIAEPHGEIRFCL